MQPFIQTFGLAFFAAHKKYLGNNMLHIFHTRQRRLLGRKFFSLHDVRSDLFEVEAVGDVIGGHEGGQQMGDGTGLATVRPERERVHPSLSGEQKTNVFFFFRGTFFFLPLRGKTLKQNAGGVTASVTRRLTCGAG